MNFILKSYALQLQSSNLPQSSVLRTEDRDLAAETEAPDPPVDPAHHADAAHAPQGGQDPERGGQGVEREEEVDHLGGAGHQEIADLKTG